MTALAQSLGTAVPAFGSLFRAIARWRADAEKRAAYRRTRDELHLLTDRELDDLGVARSEIPDVARRAVWGA